MLFCIFFLFFLGRQKKMEAAEWQPPCCKTYLAIDILQGEIYIHMPPCSVFYVQVYHGIV